MQDNYRRVYGKLRSVDSGVYSAPRGGESLAKKKSYKVNERLLHIFYIQVFFVLIFKTQCVSHVLANTILISCYHFLNQ